MKSIEISEKNDPKNRFFFSISFFKIHDIKTEKKTKKTTKIKIFNFSFTLVYSILISVNQKVNWNIANIFRLIRASNSLSIKSYFRFGSVFENMSDRCLRYFFSNTDPTFQLGFFLRGSMVARQNPVIQWYKLDYPTRNIKPS